MKANRIYHIVIIEDTQDINGENGDDFSHPFFQEISTVIDNEDCERIGFYGNDIFLQVTPYKLNEITSIMEKYLIITVSDVTTFVLLGDAEKMYPEVEELTPGLFKSFRIDYASTDDILDKIRLRGMLTLDPLDHLILERC